MKSAYPQSTHSSHNNVFLSALFFLFIAGSIASLLLRMGNIINDGRLLWVSLGLFVVSVAMYWKMAFGGRRRVVTEAYGPEYENTPAATPYANTAPAIPMAAPVPNPAEATIAVSRAEPTLAVRRAEPTLAVQRAEPTLAVRSENTVAFNPKLEQQKASTFMSLAEFTGEVAPPNENTIAIASAQPTRYSRERLQPILTEHLGWLERGALPDANGRAVLVRADLSDLPLRGTILARANLTGCLLVGTDLCEANLSGATLCQSDLAEADLRGADLRETDLRDCHLCRIDGRGADLRGAELIQSQLSGANLAGADLCEAYLSGADLSGADLSGAKLDGAYLSGAILIGADLTGACLEGIDLRRARYDETTRWPARFEPRSCGALLMNESTTGGARIAA